MGKPLKKPCTEGEGDARVAISSGNAQTKPRSHLTTTVNATKLKTLSFSSNETFTSIVNNDVARFGIEICLMLLVCIIIILCVLKNGDSLRISSCIIVPCAMFIAVTLFIEGIYRNMRGMNVLVTNIKWESLLSFDIWYTALIQFFFSSHVGLGNITTCAGRLYPKNNPFWTAICYVFLNVAIGVGFVCVLYMWVEDLISTGNVVRMPETQELFLLALIYDVMTRCYGKFAHLWAFMSYLLITLAGIISMISLIYTIVVGISIEAKNKWKWWQVCVLVTGTVFIISCCFMLTNVNIIRLLDHYVVGKLIILTTVLEVMAFVWFYGLESLSNDFEFVLGYKLNTAWKTSWFLVPIVLSMAEIWSWFSPMSSNTLSRNTDSTWYTIIGWLIYLFAWLMIAVIAAWQVFSQVDYNFSQKFVSSTKPTRNWGPVDPIYRHCWIQWKKQYQVTGEKDFTLRRRGTRDYTHSVKRGRHAGPVGMRYSVNSTSNQNTLEHKRNDNSRLQYSYSVDSPNTWNSNDFHLTTNGVKSIY
ncbi:hypothetical protein V9T40_011433 [Parthenolecanium corni]|uniref:Uncharacterized protein n=1 Tax=Parthenolecanium corni TaxID=536013 RepID=A0AAN9XYF2_9HEMI